MPRNGELGVRGAPAVPFTYEKATADGGLYARYVGWTRSTPPAVSGLSQALVASDFPAPKSQTPTRLLGWGFGDRSLTMTYSHMGKPHTTIGDASFHY